MPRRFGAGAAGFRFAYPSARRAGWGRRIPGPGIRLWSSWGGGAHLAIDNTRAPRTRVNRQIRISPVRVIGNNGDQLGVLPVDEALAMAQEQGLDLVEVAPLARPPVVKIMD